MFCYAKVVYLRYQFCCESKVLFVVNIKQDLRKYVYFLYLLIITWYSNDEIENIFSEGFFQIIDRVYYLCGLLLKEVDTFQRRLNPVRYLWWNYLRK